MIPVAKPNLGEEEAAAIREVILSGWIAQGPKVKAFEEAFAAYSGCRYACAVSNCTTALHLALLVLGVKPGDVVITVSHSFIATANSIRYCGAEPVFVDIDPATYNISPEGLERLFREDCELIDGKLFYKQALRLLTGESPLRALSKDAVPRLGRVAAVLMVHQMGMPCDLGRVLPLARAWNLPVIEDAACAIGSETRWEDDGPWEKIGRPHGDLACFSFHPRKILTTAEGGMITTSNPAYDRKLRLLRHQGMSVSDLIRHQSQSVIVEEYPVVGYNYRLTDIQAALGLAQLKKLPQMILRRRDLAAAYQRELRGIGWVELPQEPPYARTNWQSFPVRVREDAPLNRNELMQSLLDAGISTRPGIMNAHQEEPYQPQRWHLPHSEKARQETILLPLFDAMNEEDFYKVIHHLKGCLVK
ncbi:MAG TPA: aminotransferase DegT [Candidatus Omnitrophica bacterium]|nr:MAG: aminotransferase DegT [Omnitrophica WOR_2 bacterium GWA2_45_18]HBR15112.1 aminotransferase DegT [Candidatus Omnitrophota bacterium]